ncbi:hypothetical protein AtubIFM56815_003911 [Aspergillus tubingensis]|uniref:Clr5 domain-containing protein n=1 Tax=Aspergillus tubingensis TaxID=5068 RepID=A0A9W6AZ02_ASPTU|nr:hypothetical protein AtubIFM54640_002521 [Aspergillus tubingensis]GLA89434.1 hypothetical protein AtubIFM56815_003911 [Aspergillus tubingensis]GLB23142.1 hypothetical protein AtubIFM61612_003729 [Aspergillus tubingensis]
MDDMGDNAAFTRSLHQDLARKYRLHGSRIKQFWRQFGKPKREAAFRAGAADGEVLRSPNDQSMGDVYKFIPELNLRDIARPDSDYLLDHLKYRATTSLPQQYQQGLNGGPGDAAIILESMRTKGLGHAHHFRYSFTMFLDGPDYGRSYDVTDPDKYREVMAGLSTAVQAGICVPRATGELILMRQTYFLQSLNILVEDILDQGSSLPQNPRPKKTEKAAREALSSLSLDSKPEKLSLKDLAARAWDQKTALEDYLYLCRTEPEFLVHVVNIWFFSRPELVPDDRGRMLPLTTDKYISICFVEAVYNASLMERPTDRAYKILLLQELANVMSFEYKRVQSRFKRYVQVGSGSGHFKRVPGVYDNGVARVTMKTKPDTLTRSDPRLHYMLRLCQTETTPPKAVDWVKKLHGLQRTDPIEMEKTTELECDAFSDLAVTAAFAQSVSASLALPPATTKKGQMYLSKFKNLDAELEPLRREIDLSGYAIPIDNLRQPGMAQGALAALGQLVIDKTGADIGFLYQDLNESCLFEIQNQYEQQIDKEQSAAAVALGLSIPESSSSELQIAERRQKVKTRPAHSSTYNITPTTEAQEKDPESPILKVVPSTFEVFSTIFSRSDSRGSIPWSDFKAAMVDLGFSVIPRFGSVYTFSPPQEYAAQKAITLHRPHKSHIEGYRLLIIGRRLGRRYGWNQNSFEVA